ncbi:MAG: hypothetical protein HYX76_04475 [Acidobacteria bacterium]|nr:hypothetical protein [Acidobacteriota bacterium]
MGHVITTAVLVGALSAMPVVGFAAAPTATQAKEAAKSKATVASHATTGVVKSVDATTLVITKSGKKGGEMTFTLNPSTKHEGTIDVGSQVSVRYQEEGKTFVATAITARSKPGGKKK